MIKRKGQIVPKYLVKAFEKKAQHLIKFGCDVEIIGRTVKSINGGVGMILPDVKYCNLNKNKRLVKGFLFNGIDFQGFDICVKIEGDKLNGVSFENISVTNLSNFIGL